LGFLRIPTILAALRRLEAIVTVELLVALAEAKIPAAVGTGQRLLLIIAHFFPSFFGASLFYLWFVATGALFSGTASLHEIRRAPIKRKAATVSNERAIIHFFFILIHSKAFPHPLEVLPFFGKTSADTFSPESLSICHAGVATRRDY
jgi:hypothetical protein